jgi:hypothetical protein
MRLSASRDYRRRCLAPPARAARCGRFFLGLRQAGAPRGDALDFCRFEKHPTPDADGFQLSSALQPMERGFADFQKHQSFGAREQARADGFVHCGRGGGGQVLSPFRNAASFDGTGGEYASQKHSHGGGRVKISPLIAGSGYGKFQFFGKTRAAKRDGFSVE